MILTLNGEGGEDLGFATAAVAHSRNEEEEGEYEPLQSGGERERGGKDRGGKCDRGTHAISFQA